MGESNGLSDTSCYAREVSPIKFLLKFSHLWVLLNTLNLKNQKNFAAFMGFNVIVMGTYHFSNKGILLHSDQMCLFE